MTVKVWLTLLGFLVNAVLLLLGNVAQYEQNVMGVGFDSLARHQA
jgi:hypothetical protein